ncbi:MAG: multicopper oxidase domain-containing protein, partial [Deltaproteobacteria bacterium]|nr:multicopper oxidase domain-containing protein [Deltaproteobacteria bacterium]
LRDLITTSPWALKLNAEGSLGAAQNTRQVSLNEEMSGSICASFNFDAGGNLTGITQITGVAAGPNFEADCFAAGGEPMGPKAAKLGTVTGTGASALGNPLAWSDDTDPNNIPKVVVLKNGTTVEVNVTENPALGALEEWKMYNFTADAHPIHLHLVRFQVVEREVFLDTSPKFNGANIGQIFPPEPWEAGFKDTVISYPGEITKVKAKFDIPGLFVWHCHIVEHEDNEMMRPYVVGP